MWSPVDSEDEPDYRLEVWCLQSEQSHKLGGPIRRTGHRWNMDDALPRHQSLLSWLNGLVLGKLWRDYITLWGSRNDWSDPNSFRVERRTTHKGSVYLSALQLLWGWVPWDCTRSMSPSYLQGFDENTALVYYHITVSRRKTFQPGCLVTDKLH